MPMSVARQRAETISAARTSSIAASDSARYSDGGLAVLPDQAEKLCKQCMHSYCARMPTNIRLDAAAVRVLAHPLRSRLLSALRLHGPATATELADRLATNTGATSYHLRKLESVGLVEDTDEGEGKRRVWRPPAESHSWQPSDFEGDDDAETSLGWLTRDYVRTAAEQMQRWYGHRAVLARRVAGRARHRRRRGAR